MRPRLLADWLARSVSGSRRQGLLLATLLLGALVAAGLCLLSPVTSVADVVGPVQLMMSVLVPLCGVLLAHEIVTGSRQDWHPRVVMSAAAIYAAGVAVLGSAMSVIATVGSPSAQLGPLGPAWSVTVGSIGVQVTAQLVGTGLGLLLRNRVVAFAATIALPLGVWLLVGLLGRYGPLQQWVSPFGAGPPLLSGHGSAIDVAAWACVLLLWGGGLNWLGTRRRRPLRASLS